MSWRLIDSDAALTEALASLPAQQAVAVDTEFMRRNTYYPQVALLQLYAGGDALLVDPLAVRDLDGLRELMLDETRPKVLHSCSEDLEVFRRWLGVIPTPLVDTQRAAALLGEDYGLGYRGIVERLVGVELDKGETRSDWLRRPLSESQCHYAALDVIYLLPVWETLRERAAASDRLDWIYEEGREVVAAMQEREREPHRRIKGAGRLDARGTAVLQAVVAWREARAQQVDKPRGWVLDDKACLALARSLPRDRAALADLDVLPPAVLRRQGDRLLEIVAQSIALEPEELPAPPPAPLSAQQRAQLKTLKQVLAEHATALKVAPEILLPTSDLELLLRERDGEGIDEPQRWMGWRAAAVAPLRELAL